VKAARPTGCLGAAPLPGPVRIPMVLPHERRGGPFCPSPHEGREREHYDADRRCR